MEIFYFLHFFLYCILQPIQYAEKHIFFIARCRFSIGKL